MCRNDWFHKLLLCSGLVTLFYVIGKNQVVITEHNLQLYTPIPYSAILLCKNQVQKMLNWKHLQIMEKQ